MKYLLFVFILLTSCVDDIVTETIPDDSVTNPECLINYFRLKGVTGYNPVSKIYRNPTLDSIAMLNSTYMSITHTMAHIWLDGTTLAMRFDSIGYISDYFGENVAHGYIDNISAFKGWIDSPPHCANIMNKNYTKFGFSVINNYYTLVLSN